MPQAIFPHARSEGLVITELDDEILVYDKVRDKAHCLNQTAALVWKYSNGKRTVAEIASAIEKKLGSPVDEQIVWYALGQLEQDRLLQNETALPCALAGITRREFIKQMGKATLVISVPMIKSITAPDPAAVQSDCFIAGTPVWQADGTTRRIENLCAGDFVLSRDEATEQIAAQKIEKTFVYLVPESLILHLSDGKSIHTTARHPFFVDGDWVEAGHLEPKMKCVTPGNTALTVMEIEPVSPRIKSVYNLEVSPFHTFYVGESAAWVHNKTQPGSENTTS